MRKDMDGWHSCVEGEDASLTLSISQCFEELRAQTAPFIAVSSPRKAEDIELNILRGCTRRLLTLQEPGSLPTEREQARERFSPLINEISILH